MTLFVRTVHGCWVNTDSIDYIFIAPPITEPPHENPKWRVTADVRGNMIILDEYDNREDAVEWVQQFVRQMEVRAIFDKD